MEKYPIALIFFIIIAIFNLETVSSGGIPYFKRSLLYSSIGLLVTYSRLLTIHYPKIQLNIAGYINIIAIVFIVVESWKCIKILLKKGMVEDGTR